ncbi:MAG TPA: glycosyltransferase family 4 protein [Streptosporangiaceae bacterium]|nr:glycosyltransferase family 4 protein [Streptosporangiaceae bacterium]
MSADERHDLAGMRVALVLATSAGGVGSHVRSVAAGLAGRGGHVAVLGPAPTDELFGFAAAGTRFEAVDISDRPRPVQDARAVARLRAMLSGADVVHAHGLRAGALAALAVRSIRSGPPLVVTLHNAAPTGRLAGAPYAVLERIVARGAASVLAVSPDLEQRMRDLGARSVARALVPAPPAPPARADARARVRAELGAGQRPLIVTIARLAEQKGLPTLLDAAAAWARRVPRPLVAIAGDGPLEADLRARIEREDLPVRLLGRRSDVPDLLAAADVAVMPSLWEGQPLILQEILRAGRPLVATRVGGVAALLGAVDGASGEATGEAPGAALGEAAGAAAGDAAGRAGLLIPVSDPPALVAAVNRILDDPALAVRLGAAAAQRAVALPTESDAVAQLTAVYRKLIAH